MLNDKTFADLITTQTSQQLIKEYNTRIGDFVSVSTPDGSATTWTQAAHRLFTVTGTVMARVFGVVTETITGAATAEVGVAGATACFIAQLSNAGTLAAGDIFINATTATALPAGALSDYTVVTDIDIDLKTASANVTNGAITFYCQWIPVSVGAKVVAALWD